MRALWTREESSFAGELASIGPSWSWPEPVQAHVSLLIGAGGGPRTFRCIVEHADGRLTPTQADISANIQGPLEGLVRARRVPRRLASRLNR